MVGGIGVELKVTNNSSQFKVNLVFKRLKFKFKLKLKTFNFNLR